MNKVGSLPSNRVMLSQVLKRYYEPLRLPMQPGVTSSPYTRRLMLLGHHSIGSPALDHTSSATCRPCYPGRLDGKIPLSIPARCGLPHLSTRSASSVEFNEATYRFTCVTACCFANWELTTPDYSDAAPLSYRGVRTTPRTGLKPA